MPVLISAMAGTETERDASAPTDPLSRGKRGRSGLALKATAQMDEQIVSNHLCHLLTN